MDQDSANYLASKIGGMAGGIIRSIVDGRQLDQQAELAAQMFEGTNHPTGQMIAHVLRDNPETGFAFLHQFGGSSIAYNRILAMQASAREQGAVDAQNQAVLNQARIPIQGLPQPGAPGAAAGPPGMPPTSDPGVPFSAASVQPTRAQQMIPDLERVAAAHGDLAATVGTMKKLGISFGGPEPAENVLKEVGVDPDSNTGESVDAFVQHYATTGQKKFSLLKPRVTPKGATPIRPPAGTFFVDDPTAPSGIRVVAIPGSHAEITQKADAIRLKLAKGEKLSTAEQAFLDSVDRVGAIQQLMNEALRQGGGGGLAPPPAPGAPPPDRMP